MTNQHSFVSTDHFDRDLYTSSQTRERALSAAIVQAEISESRKRRPIMPLARIDLAEGKTADYRRTIGEVVYDAVVEVLKAPKDDRFQVITEHPGRISSLIPAILAFRDRKIGCLSSSRSMLGEPLTRNVPFTKQSQTDCTSVSACAGRMCS